MAALSGLTGANNDVVLGVNMITNQRRASPSDEERLRAALAKIERLSAELRLDLALGEIERAADDLRRRAPR
jgi:hypothetical protein